MNSEFARNNLPCRAEECPRWCRRQDPAQPPWLPLWRQQRTAEERRWRRRWPWFPPWLQRRCWRREGPSVRFHPSSESHHRPVGLAVRVSKSKRVHAMLELTTEEWKNEWIEIEMEREKGNFEGTMLVPYSMACSVWKVPFLPVMPWQITRVLLSTKTAGVADENWRRPWRRVAMEESNLVRACLPICVSLCEWRMWNPLLLWLLLLRRSKPNAPNTSPLLGLFTFEKEKHNII